MYGRAPTFAATRRILAFLAAVITDERFRLTRSYFMNAVKGFGAILTTLLLMAAVGCASTKTHEGTGQYVDDTVITTKVKAAILEEPGLKSSEINVETFKGVVQLSGFVSSSADISTATKVAQAVAGVTSVKNDMHVKQ
jgi:hypothetical protein